MNTAHAFLPRVLEALAAGATDRSNERRLAPRFGLHGAAELVPLDCNRFPSSRTVRVRDVSAEGVAVISAEHLPPGSRFELTIAGSYSAMPVRVVCQTQHSRRLADSTHRIGARVLDVALPAAA